MPARNLLNDGVVGFRCERDIMDLPSFGKPEMLDKVVVNTGEPEMFDEVADESVPTSAQLFEFPMPLRRCGQSDHQNYSKDTYEDNVDDNDDDDEMPNSLIDSSSDEDNSDDDDFDYNLHGPGLATSSEDESFDNGRLNRSNSSGDEHEADLEEVPIYTRLGMSPGCSESCLCDMRAFNKKRRQRRKRSNIIEARRAQLKEDKDDTAVGSLPTDDYADTARTQGADDFRALCGGVKGMQEMMRPILGTIALCEGDIEDEQALAAAQDMEWVDIEFEVALDSGSTDNVCHAADAPGYQLVESAGSRRGQNFVIGDGNKIKNQGEILLNLETGDENPSSIASTFQVAKVSRPLMSVGKICDNNMNVVFDDNKATVVSKVDNSVVCTFLRQNGGLYLTKFRLKQPVPFGRQG